VKGKRANIARIVLLFFVDFVVLLIMGLLAIFLTEGRSANFLGYLPMLLLCVVLKIILGTVFGLYNVSMRYCSIDMLMRLFSFVIVDALFYMSLGVLKGFSYVPTRLIMNITMWSYIGAAGYRVLYRMLCEMKAKKAHSDVPRAIIYGAGECGRALVRHADDGKLPYNIIGYIDDKPEYKGTIILGKKVFGNINDLERVIKRTPVACVIIAISSGIDAEKMQKAALVTHQAHADIKLAPSMFELTSKGKQESLDLRSLDYADLLGRPLIEIDRKPIADMIAGKRVLITGAGGSIGSEICRQLKTFNPSQMLLLDIDETELHNLSLELHGYQKEFGKDIFPICCDIKNEEKIREVFETFRPQIVFHAAAYKHVPMMEMYPEEAIRTNIKGSFNVLKAARDYKAEKVIVISTDKAVNPTNIMGATKRVVELEAAMLTTAATPIVCVRFGNVIGSRGSMLPLFFDQIQKGVPITVTDRKIIRYFMAIPEAVGLVFRAGAMGNSGEVMVLDMGKPVNIYDFARKLIDIYGDPVKNKIVITGLRPGEKLYEELLANKDNTIPTTNKLIFKAKVTGKLTEQDFENMIAHIMSDPVDIMVKHLEETIPEYTPKPCTPWKDYAEV